MQKNLINQIYQKKGRIINPRTLSLGASAGINFDGGLKVYNLGCGKQNFPGTIGVDTISADHIAIKHDLNIYPWPIADDSADIILAFHFMEHAGDLFKAFGEIYRVSKNGARIVIEVPHFRYSSAFKDPTHIHFFTCKTFNYFLKPNHTYPELPFKFKLVNFSIGYPQHNPLTLRYWVKKWLLRHQELYDNLLYIIFRARFLVIELEVEK